REREVERALEHPEAVRMQEMHVLLGTRVLGRDGVLEHGEIDALDLHEGQSVLARQPVAVTGPGDYAASARRAAIDAERVVLARLEHATAATPTAGRVQVEEPRLAGPRVAEAVHEQRRRSDERAGGHADRLVPEPELELAAQRVEAVRVRGMRVRGDGRKVRRHGPLEPVNLREADL